MRVKKVPQKMVARWAEREEVASVFADASDSVE